MERMGNVDCGAATVERVRGGAVGGGVVRGYPTRSFGHTQFTGSNHPNPPPDRPRLCVFRFRHVGRRVWWVVLMRAREGGSAVQWSQEKRLSLFLAFPPSSNRTHTESLSRTASHTTSSFSTRPSGGEVVTAWRYTRCVGR
jgi:hypothetical protein